MTTFYLADDGEGTPTLFAMDQITLEPFAQRDVPVLRRSDLAPDMRRFWPEIVERITGEAAALIPVPERWCCDGCARMVSRPEIAEMVDYEHVLCHQCASAQYDS